MMRSLFCNILVFLEAVSANILSINNPIGYYVPTPEEVRRNGYRCDIHNVTTEAGYVLQMHRLPGGRSTPIDCSLPPVMLMHGVLDSSFAWVTAGPQQALAYLLADLGYDVWLGNERGNTYSRFNEYFDVDDNAFWNFSWEQSGVLDLSAAIDYIMNTTGYEKILYVGHSQGTTQFFVLCSMKPEYNEKVQHMVALAPVAYLNYAYSIVRAFVPFINEIAGTTQFFVLCSMKPEYNEKVQHMVALAPVAYLNYAYSIVRIIVPFADEIVLFFNTTAHGEVLSRNMPVASFVEYFCSFEANEDICAFGAFTIFGFDPIGFNKTLLPIAVSNVPAGTSIKSLEHFAQIISSKRFQRYDYGPDDNLKLYNSVTPPLFDLSKISAALSFFYGEADPLANPQDVMDLVSQLKVKVDVYKVNLTTFNHIDFMLAKNVKTLVYDKVISILGAKQTLFSKTLCGPR